MRLSGNGSGSGVGSCGPGWAGCAPPRRCDSQPRAYWPRPSRAAPRTPEESVVVVRIGSATLILLALVAQGGQHEPDGEGGEGRQRGGVFPERGEPVGGRRLVRARLV